MVTTAAPEVISLESFFHQEIPGQANELCHICQGIKEQLMVDSCPLITPGSIKREQLNASLAAAIFEPVTDICYISLSSPAISLPPQKLRPCAPRNPLRNYLRVAYDQYGELACGHKVQKMRRALFLEFDGVFQRGLHLMRTTALGIASLPEVLWDSFYLEICYLLELYLVGRLSYAQRLQRLVELLPRVIPLGTYIQAGRKVWLVPCQ